MDAKIIKLLHGGHSNNSSPHLKWKNKEDKDKKEKVGKLINMWKSMLSLWWQSGDPMDSVSWDHRWN